METINLGGGWTVDIESDTERTVRHADRIVEYWYREEVPNLGLVWAKREPWGAQAMGYQATPPGA